MIVDPVSLESAAKAMEYQENENGTMYEGGSGSLPVGSWDSPSTHILNYSVASTDYDVYDQDITKSISVSFSRAMMTAEMLYTEAAKTRDSTARALRKIVENIGKAEDANENNAFKVFLDSH